MRLPRLNVSPGSASHRATPERPTLPGNVLPACFSCSRPEEAKRAAEHAQSATRRQGLKLVTTHAQFDPRL